MKDNILLYVKSRKVSVLEYSLPPITHSGWWSDTHSGAPKATRTTYDYTPEDQEAVALLKDSGIAHKLVDLSNCSLTARLKSKIRGINETPTLILKGKKIRGIENIRKVLQEIKT